MLLSMEILQLQSKNKDGSVVLISEGLKTAP